MPADRRDMPPVRLLPDPELAGLALAAPIFDRAVRLARWCAPQVAVDPAGELPEDELLRAVGELGLTEQPDGVVETAEAWAFAVDTGLVEADLPDDAAAGTAAPGKALELLDGDPRGVLDLWRAGLDSVVSDAVAEGLSDLLGDVEDEEGPVAADWDCEAEAAFLDGALGNLYLLTALEELESRQGGLDPSPAFSATAGGAKAMPLPVLAASMVVPDDMEVPTDAVLEEVSEAMMRLDDHFRLLAATGLVDYQPVDEDLIAEEEDAAGPAGPPDPPADLGADEVSRYGMVRLTPLGVFGLRDRLLEAGVAAPAVGDLSGRDAVALLDALVRYPADAAFEESAGWLAGRDPLTAARDLLAAARGAGPGAPARRLACQQTLSRLGEPAEPALREVLDDRELGGLARVWLVERGADDVPAPDGDMVFWLTVDTLAAQLDVDDDPELLRELVRDLVSRHEGFFDAAWRVDHPDTADVLEAVGRLHPDRAVAKEARKAAFKARSAN